MAVRKVNVRRRLHPSPASLRRRIAVLEARLSALQTPAANTAALVASLFDSVEDGLALVAYDGRCLLANSAFARMVGALWTASEEQTSSLGRLLGALIAHSFDAGRRAVERITLGEPEPCVLEVRTLPVREGGTPKMVLVHLADCTEQARLDRLIRRGEQLAASRRTAALLAHELGTPLQSVENYLFLLGLGAAGHDTYATACAELERAAEALRRTQSAGVGRRQTLIAVNALIEEVLVMLGPRIAGRRVQIARCLAPALPVLSVCEDELAMALITLVLRAVDALPCGGDLLVATRLVDAPSQPHPLVLIELSSCGREPTPAPALLAEQALAEATVRLELCHQLLLENGGSLALYDEVGGGHFARISLAPDATQPTARAGC